MGPIHTDAGYYIVHVIDRHSPRLDEDVAEEVKERIFAAWIERQFASVRSELDLRLEAYVEGLFPAEDQ